MYVCPSVTLMHPAKAVGQNEMPFGRDTCVDPSYTVVDRDPDATTERRDLGVKIYSLHQCHLVPNYFGPYYVMTADSHLYCELNGSQCVNYVECQNLLRTEYLQNIFNIFANKIKNYNQGQSHLAIGGITVKWGSDPKSPFPRGTGPRLTECYLGPHKCSCQMAPHSIQQP